MTKTTILQPNYKPNEHLKTINSNTKIAKYTNLSAPIKQLHLHNLNSHEHKYTPNFEEILG